MKLQPTTFYTYFCEPCGNVQHTQGKDDKIDYIPMFHTAMLAELNLPADDKIDPEHPLSVARVSLRFLPTPEEAAYLTKRMLDVFVAHAGIPAEPLAELIKSVVEFNLLHGTSLIITNKPTGV